MSALLAIGMVTVLLIGASIYWLVKAWRQKQKRWLLTAVVSLSLSAITGGYAIIRVTQKSFTRAEGYITRNLQQDSTKRTRGDGLFTEYDPGQPDTRANRERFEEYLKTPATDKVKQVYCYADFLGADHTIQLSFTCDTVTLRKIVQANSLFDRDDATQGRGLARAFDWWDEKAIDSLPSFTRVKEYEWHKYLWFDKATGKAYYLEFSL